MQLRMRGLEIEIGKFEPHRIQRKRALQSAYSESALLLESTLSQIERKLRSQIAQRVYTDRHISQRNMVIVKPLYARLKIVVIAETTTCPIELLYLIKSFEQVEKATFCYGFA